MRILPNFGILTVNDPESGEESTMLSKEKYEETYSKKILMKEKNYLKKLL